MTHTPTYSQLLQISYVMNVVYISISIIVNISKHLICRISAYLDTPLLCSDQLELQLLKLI